jgi:hypothetical protein
MKTIQYICFSLLGLAMVAAKARGEDFRTNINPALIYFQAILLEPKLDAADHDYLFTNDWRGQKLPPKFGELVSDYNPEFKLLRRAVQSKVPCDWGIDTSEGPATLLPHLARFKAVTQTALLRARWDLQNGDSKAAADDLVAACVLGRNISRDGMVISALVQFAIQNLVRSVAMENLYQFSPAALQNLDSGIEAAPPIGTVSAAILSEKDILGGWLMRKIQELRQQNPGNDAKVMEGIHQLLPSFDEPTQIEPSKWARINQAAGGTSDGVIQLIADEKRMEEKLAAVTALPCVESEARLAELNTEFEHSTNPFAAENLSALKKARMRELRTLAESAMLHAAIQYKLHGQAGLESVADPCGQGPFAFQRFIFEGEDRGFELKSAYQGLGYPCGLIAVEKEGPPFYCDGPKLGQARTN